MGAPRAEHPQRLIVGLAASKGRAFAIRRAL